MASLVTLEDAKTHLRVAQSFTDNDLDIQLKAELASVVILDYLKSRANVVATIDESSVAVASVITTEAAHGFSTGQTAVIVGHEDSTPDINGSYVVTVIDSTSFSIPETVTVAGTGGTATVAWTAGTVPGQVQAAVLLLLSHLYENRGEEMKTDDALWLAIGRLLMRSRDPAFA